MAHFIRKFVVRAHQFGDLVGLDSMTDQAARFLEAAVACGFNVIPAGGTQAGTWSVCKYIL